MERTRKLIWMKMTISFHGILSWNTRTIEMSGNHLSAQANGCLRDIICVTSCDSRVSSTRHRLSALN